MGDRTHEAVQHHINWSNGQNTQSSPGPDQLSYYSAGCGWEDGPAHQFGFHTGVGVWVGVGSEGSNLRWEYDLGVGMQVGVGPRGRDVGEDGARCALLVAWTASLDCLL